jgi:hypothetical protein
MDAFPSYSDIIILIGTIAYMLFYVVGICIQIWISRKEGNQFTIGSIAVVLVLALFGSTLTFVAIYFAFNRM